MPVSRAGDLADFHRTYDVRIRFGGHNGPGKWYAVEAVAIQPATPDVDVLIGMDLLVKIDMVWNGAGRLVLLDH